MEQIIPLLMPFGTALIGALLGIAGTWLVLRPRYEQALQRVQAELELARATMSERLEGREHQQQELKNALDQAATEGAHLRAELKSESERRAIAEEKNSRIPDLEEELHSRDERTLSIQSENTELRARLSEVETKLIEESKAAQESSACSERRGSR